MEDKGGFLSKIFRRKEKAPTVEATPTTQPEKPSMPSAAEDRQKRREDLQEQRKQAVTGHAIDQVTGKQAVTEVKDTSPEAIKPSVEKIGAEQTLEQAASIQEKFAPKGTPGERFGKLTEIQPETDLPANPVHQAPIKKKVASVQTSTQPPSQEITKPILSEQRTQELDKTTFEKSLQTPPSEWGKTKPATPQKPAKENDSAPPFPPGTFPGVDKWQPGKGAIVGEVLDEVKEKVQEMPKYPSSESKQEVGKSEPAYTPQKELKKAA